MTKIHALPGVTLPDTQIEPVPDVVQALEDLLQLAKEGKIRAIAHAYVTNNKNTVTGWRLSTEFDHSLTSAIHRLAWRWENSAQESDVVDMPSERE